MKIYVAILVIMSISINIVFAAEQNEEKSNLFKFTDIPAEMTDVKQVTVVDNVLKFATGGTATLNVALDTPYKIAFTVKVTECPDKKKSSFWSMLIKGKNDITATMMFGNSGEIESYLNMRGKRPGSFFSTYNVSESKPKPMQMEFITQKNYVDIFIDGKEVGIAKYTGLVPTEKLIFRGYGCSWEISDLSITPVIFTKEQPITCASTFSADFNDGINAVNEKGEKIAPISAENYELVPGIDGNALRVKSGDSGGVVYPLKKSISSKFGGIMFWIKQDNKQGGSSLIFAEGKDPKIDAFLCLLSGYRNVQFNVKRLDSAPSLRYTRSTPAFPEDWLLVTLTWNDDSTARIFANMLPYKTSFTSGQYCPNFIRADIDGIDRLIFPSNRNMEYCIDRIRIFKRPITNRDVYDEYRRFMPIDMVIYNAVMPADTPGKINLQISPAGYFTRPMPIDPDTLVKATSDVTIDFVLKDKVGNIILNNKQQFNVDRMVEVFLPPVTLPTGKYILECVVNNAYKRSFELLSFTSKYKSNPVDDDLKIGRLIYHRNLNVIDARDILKQGNLRLGANDSYLEAGTNRNDRFGFEIPFPNEVLGKPVALDITWPDDKMRMIGFYMYPSLITTNYSCLSGGVLSGNEFPNSGKMITSRHIFYPGVSKYLFEARTMGAGMPAAVAEIKIYEIENGLPALKINAPTGMPGRHFGFPDEDQSFTHNLNEDSYDTHSTCSNKLREIYPDFTMMMTDEIMRYFDYTGMNSFHMPLWRYGCTFFPVEGAAQVPMYPGTLGRIEYVINAFSQANKKFMAQFNFHNLPELTELDNIDANYKKEGLETLDRFGDTIYSFFGNHFANIAHPKVQRFFIEYIDDPLRRFARSSSFSGIEYCLFNFGTWKSLDYGYDDYTITKFSKETGEKVPCEINERYAFLTKEPIRAKWLKWRSEQVTNWVKIVRAVMDKYNPDLTLLLNILQEQGSYENRGIDFAQLKKIPNVKICITRLPMMYRWDMFYGRPESTINEELYDFNNKSVTDYLVDGAVDTVISHHNYYESGEHPLDKNYKSYFSSNDVKPHGRFFLKEPAFAVGAFDAQEYLMGGQALAVIGRDAEAREFAKAYCALPAKRFNVVSGIKDPAIARYLPTTNGTYFYVVNMCGYDIKVKLDLMTGKFYTDLSTGEVAGNNTISLKPFQLRSFLYSKEAIVVSNLQLATIDDTAKLFYAKRVEILSEAADLLERNGIDVSFERKDIEAQKQALAAGNYAELHRVAFCKRMNLLLRKQEKIQK